MSFLRGKPVPRGQAIDYLCEAQVSVLIAAINQTVWTGYCFVDTYHEPEDRRQTVEKYYKNQFKTQYAQRCLQSIQQSFVDSKKCLKELEGIRTLCDEHKEALSLYGIDRQNHISQLQTKAAENAQTMSHFLLYVLSPVTIAATMLSMQEKAIPTILGPTKVSFFILTPVLTLAVYALSWMIRSWEKIQRFFHHIKPRDVYQPETIDLEEVV
ncbi:hypothetical protein FSPOR_5870 [Fusarium sporotrichioides]|uniref:Uncharacterized protein n=1 Tax=Fusarium sporotrichioides TaxID=5514 RepID=A0A395S5P0_FUSSP|nr:hypothetical protein FSPOR_5870 [Fusarium sporotrichioides]